MSVRIRRRPLVRLAARPPGYHHSIQPSVALSYLRGTAHVRSRIRQRTGSHGKIDGATAAYDATGDAIWLVNAQRAYDAIQQRFTQTSLESQTTQSNVNVLTQAVPPTEHSSPRILLNTLLAVFVGTLLAVGMALVLELRDRRVRGIDDVIATLDLPVIGVMPKPGSRMQFGRTAGASMQQRLMAPLPQLNNKGA